MNDDYLSDESKKMLDTGEYLLILRPKAEDENAVQGIDTCRCSDCGVSGPCGGGTWRHESGCKYA